MPTKINSLHVIGMLGLMAGAGCTSTSPVTDSASLAPVETPSVVAAGLPQSLELKSVDREIAFADEKTTGTSVVAVAYAAPEPGSLTAIQLAVEGQTAQGSAAATAQQAVAASAQGEHAAEKDARVAAYAPATGQTAASQALAATASAEAAQGTAKPSVVVASLSPTPGEPVDARSPELDTLISRYAKFYEVPVDLVRRVVKRESTFNPRAKNGPYLGLMQIRHDTAKGMGYSGPASGLLDAETNLTYAVKYLRGAYITAKGDHDQAVRFYSRGYYYDAKKRGLLNETGLKPGANGPVTPVQAAVAAAGQAKLAAIRGEKPLLQKGQRVTTTTASATSLPGVGQSGGILNAPSSARMGGEATASIQSGSQAGLAIAE